MNEFDQQNAAARPESNVIESLSLEFNGLSFYGLEYVVEDFFQPKMAKSTNFVRTAVDWFGLYD